MNQYTCIQPFSAHLEHFSEEETDKQYMLLNSKCFDMLVLTMSVERLRRCFSFCIACNVPSELKKGLCHSSEVKIELGTSIAS